MYFKKVILLTLFAAFCFGAQAQRSRSHNTKKSSYTRDRYNYNAARVKGAKAKVACPIFEDSKYPYHGLGVKLGDPFALTYKFYPNKSFALAIDAGKPASGLYNHYYRQQFGTYYARMDTMAEGASITYLTHKVKSDFILEAKVLYHFDAKVISPGLQFYVGAGWEWKNTQLRYDYVFESGGLPGPNDQNNLGNFSTSRFTQGPQAVIGIEYSYFQLPISAFMELEYFTDVELDPGWSRVEGGVGLRYIF
jgi:hypothetical protein